MRDVTRWLFLSDQFIILLQEMSKKYEINYKNKYNIFRRSMCAVANRSPHSRLHFKPHWKRHGLVLKCLRSAPRWINGCSSFDGCHDNPTSICTERLELTGSQTHTQTAKRIPLIFKVKHTMQISDPKKKGEWIMNNYYYYEHCRGCDVTETCLVGLHRNTRKSRNTWEPEMI